MAVLFAKLENMLQNSVYVNFLLTGLVAQLACHPLPFFLALPSPTGVFCNNLPNEPPVFKPKGGKILVFQGLCQD